jgi:hypothetical protein
MSKSTIPVTENQPQPAASRPVSRTAGTSDRTFMFSKDNYMLMFIGLGVIILGFILMAGGKSADPNVFNYDEIYSARRISIAPLLVLIGLAIEGYAIMKKPKSGLN